MRRLILIVSAAFWSFALAGHAKAADITLRIACYAGAYQEAQARYTGIVFTLRTGIKLQWFSGNSTEFLAKMIANKGRPPLYDVVYVDEIVQAAAIQAGLFQKIDPSIVTNLQHLYDEAKHKDGYGPGTNFWTIGLVYNTEAFKKAGIPEPTSWNDLWDPRLAGRIALPDIVQSSSRDLIIATARLLGGDESNTTAAFEKHAQLKPLYFFRSAGENDIKMLAGEAWIAVWLNARAWNLIDRGAPLKFVYPKEGGFWHTTTVDVTAGTPYPKEAMMFVNQVLDPLAQIGQANEVPYGPANKLLAPVLAAYPELSKKFPANSEDLKKLNRQDPDVVNREYPKWIDTWNRVMKK
ncbi:MAG: PotD/PotF family extracellular solute-binding protein [Pseudorhodoplanes sp.]